MLCRNRCPAPPIPKQMSNGIQAQLIKHPEKNLADKEVVIFDNIVNQTGTNNRYNPSTGIFTLHARGLYLINWNISVSGTGQKPFVRFGIMANGQIQGSSARPTSVGELHGSNLVTVMNSPVEIAFVNDTGDFVQYSEVGPIANITIVQINS